MARYRSKLMQTLFALLLLVASTMLWPSLGTTATYAMRMAATPIVCPTPSNSACLASSPTVGTTLNGTDQSVSYSVPFTLDNSVSRTWNVTFALTRFTTASLPHRTLPTSSTITNVTLQSTCTNNCPANGVSYSSPLSVTAGGQAVKIYNNTQTNGQKGIGTFSFLISTNASVPANSYAGTYTSTITIAFIAGSP